MEDADFPSNRFDLVVSSLAFHYVADYDDLCRRIARWLTPGGILVFSTEHPVYLSRATSEGWLPEVPGEPRAWALHRYGDEGLREESWIVDGVRKHHRMVSTLVNGPIAAGLTVERLVEPMPDEATLRRRPDWAQEINRPFCLLLRARKP
jgi:SAM-dependent methyltransferase